MRAAAVLPLLVVGLAACGDDPGPGSERPATEAGAGSGAGAAVRDVSAKASGTRVEVRGSQFGPMLYDSRRQAIYVFERDTKSRSNCYGECARLWPPVYAKGKPRAGKGAKASLLGTTKRRGGRLQVTYAGRPLYFYAHEGPGEVECHNVDLNGGVWKVVSPRGTPRA